MKLKHVIIRHRGGINGGLLIALIVFNLSVSLSLCYIILFRGALTLSIPRGHSLPLSLAQRRGPLVVLVDKGLAKEGLNRVGEKYYI